jgi:hypothetical protein
MPKFPDICPDVEGFVRKRGHGFEIRAGCCSLCHRVIPFHSVSLPDEHTLVDGEAGTRGCGLPSYTQKVELAFIQTRMKDFTHIPQLDAKDVLITFLRFCEPFSEES